MTKKITQASPVAEQLRALFHNHFNHLTVVSGVSSRLTMSTCETGQVLLAGVPGGFSRGTPVFAPPTVWCFSYELK